MLTPFPPTQLINSLLHISANMSIFGSSHNSKNTMGSPSFRELKNQASFYFKEKIKTARLALTDVTPAQLLAEEVTAGNHWGPGTQSMRLIVKAAFEVDDYWRIVEILHKRLSKFDKQNWRVSYNSLILLEHLLTHGPESAAEEFQTDKDIITEMQSFQYTDDKGFNWGLAVRKKSERVLSLLENRPFLKQERDRARKVTCGIKGFGSFGDHRASDHGILKQSSSFGAVAIRDNLNHDPENNNSSTEMEHNGDELHLRLKETDSFDLSRQVQSHGTSETENGKADIGVSTNEDHHHPFCHAESQASASLLTTSY